MSRRLPRSTLFPYTTLFRSTSSPPRQSPSWASSTGSPRRSSGASHWYRVRKARSRSEEHTSELQSRFDLVCRLLLEKKKVRNLVLAAGYVLKTAEIKALVVG